MLFNCENARNSSVYDVESGEKIAQVLEVDTLSGDVVFCPRPLRVKGDEIEVCVLHFDSIYAIYGGANEPVLFHCYGRHA